MKIGKLLLMAFSISLFVSCSNDDENNAVKGEYVNGFFIKFRIKFDEETFHLNKTESPILNNSNKFCC